MTRLKTSLRKFNDHCDIPFRFELYIGNANPSNFVSRVNNLQLPIEFFQWADVEMFKHLSFLLVYVYLLLIICNLIDNTHHNV